MTSHTTERFWKCFEKLPQPIQAKAKSAFKLWQANTDHPSLHFKKIHSEKSIYSVRVGLSHRSIGVREENTMIWFLDWLTRRL